MLPTGTNDTQMSVCPVWVNAQKLEAKCCNVISNLAGICTFSKRTMMHDQVLEVQVLTLPLGTML